MVLITGVNGFVGQHLAEACFSTGKEIAGIGYGELDKDSGLNNWLKSYKAIDLTDESRVSTEIELSGVECVFHLAGLAAVGPSFDHPARYIADNSAMLINLAEKALKDNSKARFIIVSSGAVYDSSQQLPISESGKTVSDSPYAISKITTELFCAYYRSRGLDMIVVRPFNHIGPGQGPGFILPDLTEQAKNYAKTGSFMVGNLETKRDYTDVRDVVQAYIALSEGQNLSSNLYNVCSGKSYSGQEILAEICKNMSIDSPKVEVNQSKIRPNDAMDIYGDNSKLKADTGWSPKFTLAQSVADFINNS